MVYPKPLCQADIWFFKLLDLCVLKARQTDGQKGMAKFNRLPRISSIYI